MKRNPFRARQLQPGRIPYLFPESHDIAQVVGRFISSGYRGQIVGPHGTGKSTLLRNVASELRQRKYQVMDVTLTPQPKTPRLLRLSWQNQLNRKLEVQLSDHSDHPTGRHASGDKRVVTIDGCEVASWWERFRFFHLARRAGWGVLITTHRDLGFPTIWETHVTAETARQIIQALIAVENSPGENSPGEANEYNDLAIPDELVEQLLAKHCGNMREVLFSLYDRYRV